MKQFKFTPEDFLSGQFEQEFQDAVQGINLYSDSINDFTAIRPSTSWMVENEKIARNFPQLPYIISSWQSNIGANGSMVVISTSEDNSPSTQKRKKLIQKRTRSLIETKHKWKNLELQIIKKIVVEGNAVLMLNKDGVFIVESINRFSMLWDNQNKIAKYSYLVNGSEKAGMTDLTHGVDLWHFRDPIFTDYPIAPSRIQAAMAMIMLENKATRLNTHMFANGYLSNIFLKFQKEGSSSIMEKLADQERDKENKTWKDRILDIFSNNHRGVKNAGKVGIIPYLEDIIKVSSSNKDSQYLEMMKQLTPERVAWAYSMTLADFGAGESTTYNNVATFNDALYDKLGRPLEQLLDDCRNEFVLKLEGLTTTEDFYIQYNEPEDPNKVTEIKEKREDWKTDAITLNEYREMRGLPFLPDGDVTFSEWTAGKSPQPEMIANSQLEDPNLQLFTKAVEFAKKTPTEKALETEEYTKFYNRFDKSITKQLKTWLDGFTEEKPEDLENYKVKLPKLESFYAFNVLKKDLLGFAGLGLDEVKKDKRIKFKLDFFDGEFPKSVLEAIDSRTEMLLKGLGDYEGLDAETTKQINTYLSENASDSLADLTKKLVSLIPKLSATRAETIAQTEVANAVEGARHTMYLDSFPNGTKKWLTAKDERVRTAHKNNESDGKIPITELFSNGNDRAGQDVRCRCTTLYYDE